MENLISQHTTDYFVRSRRRMVEDQLIKRGITDKKVLDAMSRIPRHIFVDEALQNQAYSDYPLGIGEGQTISQPYIVALMTQSLQLNGDENVLEIGMGCGYQTSVLALLCSHVYTIERLKVLGLKGRRHLKNLNYRNITIRIGDGTNGWPDKAPFDAILTAAGSPEIPQPLVDQLKIGGRLVVPVGSEDSQNLFRVTKTESKTIVENLGSCRFVKLVGRHGWSRQKKAGDRFTKRSLIVD